VYAVKPDRTVEVRPVALGPQNDADAAIERGVAAGEVVVVDGIDKLRAGTTVELTATEFRLLRYLMQNAPRVLSKAQILDHVWQYDFGGDANIVETYVSYLRRKVDGIGPPLIHTVRGVGYRLAVPRDQELRGSGT
jgi:DNA-binding response OmpR family regulator